MAIKRLDPKAIFKLISANDSALLESTLVGQPTGEKNPDGSEKMGPSGYEKYIEEGNFNESFLEFNGEQPDRFLVRSLTPSELAELNTRYIHIDTLNKRMVYTNRNKMFLDMFNYAYLGVEGPDGVTSKPSTEEIPYNIQVEIGAMVSMITSLGKNEKK